MDGGSLLKKRSGGAVQRNAERGIEPIDWVSLQAFATQCLGLTRNEFWWGITLVELDAYAEYWRSREDHANYRAGIIAAAVKNSQRAKNSKVWAWTDFFQKPAAAAKKTAVSTQSPEEIWLNMGAFFSDLKALKRK